MAIVTVQDIYRRDSCKAASDELGRGCKHGNALPSNAYNGKLY